MDFTLVKYTDLLKALKNNSYRFVTFEEYCTDKETLTEQEFVILRHDVDLKAENSFATAKIEHGLGVRASYYFRVVEQSNKPDVIKSIADLGHEIGYHYEDLTICKGNTFLAFEHFKKKLDYFRQFYPVKTICMHGSPRSKFDGRDLWKEPYFDVDFSNVFYLTDTGRRWDGFNVSVRDKVSSYQNKWIRDGLVFHSTDDVIKAIANGTFPKRLMMTTHPQRWTDNCTEWFMELVGQCIKNKVKRILVKRK